MHRKYFNLFALLMLVLAISACDNSLQNSSSSQDAGQKAPLCVSSISMPASGSSSTAPSSSSFQHMEMGPHMRMTTIRLATSAEFQRANAIIQNAQICFDKYKDYRVALQDGYQIFAPNVPQDIYHFAAPNFNQVVETFDLAHPSALLYRKVGNGYQFVGIMYSAPAEFTEDQLNARFPLGVAPWHLHINICLPAGTQEQDSLFPPRSQFGLDGAIATEVACQKAGGMFYAQMFGWMVHVYPWGSGYPV